MVCTPAVLYKMLFIHRIHLVLQRYTYIALLIAKSSSPQINVNMSLIHIKDAETESDFTDVEKIGKCQRSNS